MMEDKKAVATYRQRLTKDSVFDAVVLCDGDYPSHEIPLSLLQSAAFLCCCDGAGQKLIARGGNPDAIVGDGDSLPEVFKQQYADVLHLVDEQEDNDQTKATRYCMTQGFKRIAYLGCTGRREDHTLGNISLLMRYMHDFGLEVTMVTDHGYFTPCFGTTVFDTFPHQQVSIFNFGCTSLSGEGFRWDAYPYQELWQGTLNEAVGDTVCLRGNGSYLVFRTFDPKLPLE